MRKKSLCVVSMAISLLMAGRAFAANPSDLNGFIDVPNQVIEPIYNFIVPTTGNFAIDPFAQMDESKKCQIFSSDFVFLNKSNIPVKITVSPFLTVNDSTIELKNSPQEVNQDSSSTKKEAYICMAVADTIGEDHLDNPSAATATSITYVNSPEVKIGSQSGDAELVFALPSASYDNNGQISAVTTSAISSTRLKGNVNPSARWADSDLKLTFAYDVAGLTKVQEKELRDNRSDSVKKGKNLVDMSGTTSTKLTFTPFSKTNKNNPTLTLSRKPSSITSVTINGVRVTSADFSYVSSTGVITLKGNAYLGQNAADFAVGSKIPIKIVTPAGINTSFETNAELPVID